jgi:ABC-type multidrug transport system ATPase subunit
MDPEARRFMWSVIHKISKKRKKSSVILTTHSMEEAETLCRRIGIMADGEFKILGSTEEIKNKLGDEFEVHIRVSDFPPERNYSANNQGNCVNLILDKLLSQVDVNNFLSEMGKAGYIRLLTPTDLGKEFLEEVRL